MRTVTLFDQAGLAPRGSVAAPVPLRWGRLPLGATLDFFVDATLLLASPADTIRAQVGTVTNLTLVAGPAVSGGLVTLSLAGVDHGDGVVDLSLFAVSGRQARRFIRVAVV
jgi:hypothetical protein